MLTVGEALAESVALDPKLVDSTRASMLAGLKKERAAPPPAPTQHWAIAAGYEGIEQAQVVVVNLRNVDERPGAQRLVDDLAHDYAGGAVGAGLAELVVIVQRGHQPPEVVDLARETPPHLRFEQREVV